MADDESRPRRTSSEVRTRRGARVAAESGDASSISRGRKPDDGMRGTLEGKGRGDRSFSGIRSLTNPLWCYHGFRIVVVILTCFGVVMVFSSSTVSLISSGQSPWKQALSQSLYCVIGLAVGFAAMHVSVEGYRRITFVLLIIALLAQLSTMTGLGVSVNGNSGWIAIGPVTAQPAEFMKLVLCLWLPKALGASAKTYPTQGAKAFAMPAGVFALCLGTVLLGKDLGTALIIIAIGVVAFLLSGFPMRWFLAISAVLVAVIGVFVVTSPNRMKRIFAAYQTCTSEQAQQVCYQAIHAKYAMASGGLLGVGIGNSKEKWNYLPEAHNDFIFAIIGEETGFVGAAAVILLFVIMGWCLVVVALQTRDSYASMVLLCITTWIVGQGLVNVMVVVGLFPVMGVPMPFVSAGGSSLIMCLTAAGVAVSMMRRQSQIHDYVTALSS